MAHYRPIILAFLDYYLPGYRAGGPIRTISNFVDHFGDEFEILIVTRDRDVLDIKSYTAINVDSWTSVGKAKVYYASEKMSSFSGVVRILNEHLAIYCT